MREREAKSEREGACVFWAVCVLRCHLQAAGRRQRQSISQIVHKFATLINVNIIIIRITVSLPAPLPVWVGVTVDSKLTHISLYSLEILLRDIRRTPSAGRGEGALRRFLPTSANTINCNIDKIPDSHASLTGVHGQSRRRQPRPHS